MRGHNKPALIVLSVFVIIMLGIIFHKSIHNQLNDWKVLPEPEKLTELYFTHPNSLPTTYTPGQSQTISFTVHNIEYQTENYKYKITELASDGQKSQVLSRGKFTLPQDKYQHKSVNISTPDLGHHVKVEVTLTNLSESIDYLLNRSGS
jgi:uncharacterized membrane protein